MKTLARAIWLVFSMVFAVPAAASVTDARLKELVLQALPGVNSGSVVIRGGQGKIDADPQFKLSYFVFTPDPEAAETVTTLIPMATSRFDATNYNTDAWWDVNKAALEAARRDGTPAPKQDPREVAEYLRSHGLSTNPEVVKIAPESGRITREPLQEFLLGEYLREFEGRAIPLYRGAERSGEPAQWRAGQAARGARYWTPDANYAWRYARKDPQFLEKLADGESNILKFEIPRDAFVRLVRGGDLIIGTEMTKRTHDGFAREGRFIDHLSGGADYLGFGRTGLEFEIRGRAGGRTALAQYFRGQITPSELAEARKRQIELAYARLLRQQPARRLALESEREARLARAEAEGRAFAAVEAGESAPGLPGRAPEFVAVDHQDFGQFLRARADRARAGVAAHPMPEPGFHR